MFSSELDSTVIDEDPPCYFHAIGCGKDKREGCMRYFRQDAMNVGLAATQRPHNYARAADKQQTRLLLFCVSARTFNQTLLPAFITNAAAFIFQAAGRYATFLPAFQYSQQPRTVEKRADAMIITCTYAYLNMAGQ